MNRPTPVKLKPKTKAMIGELLRDPKLSQTEAYLRTHQTTNRDTARANASELLASTNVQIYMQEHLGLAKEAVVDLVKNARSEDVRLRASQDILDREHGKARQQIDVTSKSVEIKIAWPTPPSPLSE